MGRVAIGNRRVPLVEFVGACVYRDLVVLDTTVLNKVDANLGKTTLFKAKIDVNKHDGVVSGVMVEMSSRAVTLQLLIRLMSGKYQVP